MLMWKKLLRDLWLTRSRALVMVASIAIGLAAFNTLVGAYSILTREVVRSYVNSKPASVILEMDEVSDRALAQVRSRADIRAATRRAQLRGRFSTEHDPEKRRAFLFVVDDFLDTSIARVSPESGSWPPEAGTVAIERSAIPVVGGGIGTALLVDLPGHATERLRVGAIAHEPALAPANTEQAVYAYISGRDLARRGISARFDELRFTPKSAPNDPHLLEKKAREVAHDLERAGLGKVTAIRIPPPGRHPHQSQMTTVLSLFVVFAGLIVILSSLLTASLISTMMARQVREIGILKTLGARKLQVLTSYAFLLESIALVAWGLGFFPAEAATGAFVDTISHLLNFDVVDPSQSGGARLLQATVALCVPLLVALPALVRGSGFSVLRAVSDYGVTPRQFGRSRLERWAARVGARSEFFLFALRNAIRRRGRFFLSLALLTTAGAIFLAGINTARSWEVVTQRLYTSRHYDFEVGLSQPFPSKQLEKRLEERKEIEQVETWLSTRTAPGTGHALPIERTYPDGAHGAFALVMVPPKSKMVTFDVQEGRFLQENQPGEVVLNQVVPGSERYAVGDDITLSINGEDRVLRVVGKVEEVGTGAAAYVTKRTFYEWVEEAHRETWLRIQKAPSVGMTEALAATNEVLLESKAEVTQVLPLTVFENAVAAHFEILIRSLLALAGLTALVGTMGLSSALSANVAESARELAVLRAIGATGRQIRSLVVREALLICGSSYFLAIAFGLGLSSAIGYLIGMMSFRLPLPLSPEHAAFFGLLVVLLVLGTLASALPARRASSLTVTQALRSL